MIITKDQTVANGIIPNLWSYCSTRLVKEKRDWDDSYWTSSGGARWAFFAIFVVLIIVVVLGTIRVNKKRSQQGMQPIYGTRWMTPPSYRQSQNQYQQPDHVRDPDLPSAYVPIYTATANEYDMGYYDLSGQFHPNPNAKSPIQHPPEAHQRSTTINTIDGTTLNATTASNLPSDINNPENSYDDDESLGNIYRSSNAVGHSPSSNGNFHSDQGQTHTFVRQEISSNSEGVSDLMPGAFSAPSGPPPSKQLENGTETVIPIHTAESSVEDLNTHRINGRPS